MLFLHKDSSVVKCFYQKKNIAEPLKSVNRVLTRFKGKYQRFSELVEYHGGRHHSVGKVGASLTKMLEPKHWIKSGQEYILYLRYKEVHAP